MATFTGMGFSQNPNPLEAITEATTQAKKSLNKDRIDLALIFNTLHYDPKEFLPVAFESLRHTRLIGASSPAIIVNDQIHSQGISVLILASDNIKYETAAVNHLNLLDKHDAGKTLIKSTLTDFGQQQRKMTLCFTDGLLDGLPDLIKGIKSEFLYDIPLVVVGCSDDYQLQKMYQYHKETVMSHGITSLILGGRFLVGIGHQHGFNPIGMPRTINKVDGTIIREINGKKASLLFDEYFGDEAHILHQGVMGKLNFRYPLGVRLPGQKDFTLRHVMGVGDGGSIFCQDQVPVGAEVHLMISNQASFLKAAEDAAQHVKEQLERKRPHFLLIIESLSRLHVLGRSATEELKKIRNILGLNIPIIGMYSQGEYVQTQKEIEDPLLLQNGSIIIIGVH